MEPKSPGPNVKPLTTQWPLETRANQAEAAGWGLAPPPSLSPRAGGMVPSPAPTGQAGPGKPPSTAEESWSEHKCFRNSFIYKLCKTITATKFKAGSFRSR